MLGPLRVRNGADWKLIGASQQRLTLAVLLIEAGRLVTKDRLAYEIWGERPPPTAVSTINGYAMRLRRLLDSGTAATLVTRAGGYELELEDGAVDAGVFERLLARGRSDAAGGRWDAAVGQLTQALALWQGPALADVLQSPAVVAEVARLELRRLSALEALVGAELELGRHAEVVDELSALVARYPEREQLWAHLMVALYRCGRRVEALETYRRIRTALADETGVEPGPALRALERAILADDPTLAGPVLHDRPAERLVVVPAQLPAAVAGFTGRDELLARLDELLPADGGSALPIAAVEGMAGVGKTALVVHWAHRVRHLFPDGQLFADLCGYADRPALEPIEVLARFLPALGVPPEQIPLDPAAAADLYRSVLAGKQVLVVLDNARDPAHVRPLLPAGTGSMVVITSRDELRGLAATNGAVRIAVGVLSEREARDLLAELLGADRVEAEPAATAELVRLCGHLPLALRVAAANFAGRSAELDRFNALLAAEDRLAVLGVDRDPHAATRSAFALSYRAQPPEARRLFRLLALVPGSDFTAVAAAATADLPAPAAEGLLERLAAAHLIEQRRPGRYGFHDLVRLYAAERSVAEDTEADRRAAADRLYRHYLDRVDAAARRLYPHIARVPDAEPQPPATDGTGDHREWLDAERHNLVAAVTRPAPGQRTAVWRLADGLRGYLWLGMHLVDWRAVARAAVEAATADGDLRGRAAAHQSLATLHWHRNDYRTAITEFERALDLVGGTGWIEGECSMLANLGSVYGELGQLAKAAEHHELALRIDRRLGDLAGQATDLGNLATSCLGLGRLREAVEHCREAIAILRRLGHARYEGAPLACLGEALYLLGRHEEALACLDDALAIQREAGEVNFEADTLRVLAAVHGDLGHHTEARELAAHALTLARQTGDRYVEAHVLAVTASADDRAGNHTAAIDAYQRALTLAREVSARQVECVALAGLAATHHHAGHPEQAAAIAAEALAVAREFGYRLLEESALGTLAATAPAWGRLGDDP